MSQNTNALLKALSENQEAVVYALDATALVQESMERLEAWPPATKHLGQAMMASLLLQALADAGENESLSLQWMCDGPFGHCYAETRNFGQCRGTIRIPQAPIQDYETSLGAGLLQVRKTKDGFSTTSIVNSQGDVSLDVVEYLEQSEQKNCGINLSVHIDWVDGEEFPFRVVSAYAYLIHILPQPTEAKLSDALVRWNRQMHSLGAISSWALRKDQTTLDMLRVIMGEEEPKVVMNQRVEFSCHCSEYKALKALAMVEQQEMTEGSFKPEINTEIRCEFCGRVYLASPKPAPRGSSRTSAKPNKKPGKKPAEKLESKATAKPRSKGKSKARKKK